MREPTLLLQTGLMFVGTAPTSTSGGVRVATHALVFLVIFSLFKGGG
jgi:Trk-type K+ transport system membrane component